MFNKWIFLLSLLLIGARATAFNLPINPNNTDCDTLITVDGKIFVITIKDASTDFILFTKCDDLTQENFTIPWSQIAQLKKHKDLKVIDTLSIKPVGFDKIPNKSSTLSNGRIEDLSKCQDLIFEDGKELKVQIVTKDILSYYYMICGTDDRVYMVSKTDARLLIGTASNKSAPPGPSKSGSGKGCLITLMIVLGIVLLSLLLVSLG